MVSLEYILLLSEKRPIVLHHCLGRQDAAHLEEKYLMMMSLFNSSSNMPFSLGRFVVYFSLEWRSSQCPNNR